MRDGLIKGLSAVLLPQRPENFGHSITQKISKAATRLAESLHVPSATSQLLGAITSLEILLVESSDFPLMGHRLIALVGAETNARYDTKGVFRARHEYVHEGMDPDPAYTLKGLALSLSCLVRYAELASAVPSKAAIISYLDSITQAERASDWLREGDKRQLEGMLRHRREGLNFAGFEHTLGKLSKEATS